jgi:hypothetical protein
MFLHERLIASKAFFMEEWQKDPNLISNLPEVNEEERKYF